MTLEEWRRARHRFCLECALYIAAATWLWLFPFLYMGAPIRLALTAQAIVVGCGYISPLALAIWAWGSANPRPAMGKSTPDIA